MAVGLEEDNCWALLRKEEDIDVVVNVGEGEELVIDGEVFEDNADIEEVDAGLGETPLDSNLPPTTTLFGIATPRKALG